MRMGEKHVSVPEVLADCPRSPNCVSSVASDPQRRVAPIDCEGTCEETLHRLREILASTPGASIVAWTDTYLRAEFTSRVFHFVDDLELMIDADRQRIHLRSASRVGSWDYGVNRRRVERLRERLTGSTSSVPRQGASEG